MAIALLSALVVLTVEFRFANAADDICNQTNYHATNGTINSPNYPLTYPSNLDCNYTIAVPEGFAVYFRFIDFDTEWKRDYLTVTCNNETAFGPRTFSSRDYMSTLFISSCRRVYLLFITDDSRQDTGFSIVYSFVPAQKIIEGFNVRPSNIFLQSNAGNTITLNCTSTSGFLPWWMFQRREADFNRTVTNGFCNLSGYLGFRSDFFSESLGLGSCNLVANVKVRAWRGSMGTFTCNYGSSASAAAILAIFDSELQYSKQIERAAEAITDLEPTADDEVQYSCIPGLSDLHDGDFIRTWIFRFSGQRSSVAQIRVERTYWTDEKGRILSNSTSGRSAITAKAQTVSGVHVFPNYTCNSDVLFFTNITFMDKSAPSVLTFSTGTVRIPFGPEKETMSIVGDDDEKIIIGGILSCHAHAYPAATYQWTDESTGQLVNGPTIAVTHSGQYTCTASNSFYKRVHQESKTIAVEAVNFSSGKFLLSGYVSGESLNSKTIIILVAVVGVVVLLINIIFSLGLFLRFKRSTEQNRCSKTYVKRLNPTSRAKANNGPSDESHPDDFYASDMRYHRMSSRNSQEPE